jgi:hypothetical protein
LINSDLSIQENHQNKDIGAIVSVFLQDDLKHLSKVTGAFIGTRSIPYFSRIMVLTKKISKLALKGCCLTEMERVAGSDQKKYRFLINQLI